MASLNKFMGIGNLGRDPETRPTSGGDSVTSISIGITDKWKDKNGDQKESTEWVRVVFFGKLAGIAAKYLKKGSQVYVEGRMRTKKFTDKDGVDRLSTEIIADMMQMLGGVPKSVENEERGGNKAAKPAPAFDDMDSEIPF
jgi:single-strand DNA-binding protein